MDGRLYTPGAGHKPPVLAGRDDLRQQWRVTCSDVLAAGRIASDDLVLVGPRGVGKTAALNALSEDAAGVGFDIIRLQAVQGGIGLVDSLVRLAERRIGAGDSAWSHVRDAFARIAGVSVGAFGISGSVAWHQDPARAAHTDAMSIADTLAALSEAIGAERTQAGLVVTIDELQMAGPDLAMLAGVLHRLNSDHPQARILFAGTGLPNTRDRMRVAGVTHADRLFDFLSLPVNLSVENARYALVEPALSRGVVWDSAAVDRIIDVTGGFPSHLQAFAHATWQVAQGERITLADARIGIERGAADYERRTIGPRWDDLSPRQREYLAALAALGGHARSSEVSHALGRTTQATSQTRAGLIEHGDIHAAPGNRVAFSVPLAAAFVLSHYEEYRLGEDHPETYTPLAELRAARRGLR